MPTARQQSSVEPWRRRLYLPAYTISDAARYAGANTQTVSYWFRGGGELGPALGGKEAGKALNYLQLIETAFVKTFRDAGVSLQRLRRARAYVQQRLKSDYPFARHDFQTDGFHVFMELSEIEPELGVDQLFIAADTPNQPGWALIVKERFQQFEYVDMDGDSLAVVWRPSEKQPAVVIDARKGFGAPAVEGVPTWALAGRARAGESIGEIAFDFNVSEELVSEALEFEGLTLAA